jgi:hypothetical protein
MATPIPDNNIIDPHLVPSGIDKPADQAPEPAQDKPKIPAEAADGYISAIRKCLDEITKATRTSVSAALEAGALLTEAKGLIKHGKWTDWLDVHFSLSETSARRYMRLAKPDNRKQIEAAMDTTAKTATAADFTMRGAESLIIKPKTEKQLAAEARRKATAEANKAGEADKSDEATDPDYNPAAKLALKGNADVADPKAVKVKTEDCLAALSNLRRNDVVATKTIVRDMIKRLEGLLKD